MDIVGYCIIRKGAKTGNGASLEKFIGETVRVMEFCSDGGVMVLSRDAQTLATFDKEDVQCKFECKENAGYIFPPDMDIIAQLVYMTKVQTRKGGLVPILKEMIILNSLHKGVFTDNLLWAKQ